MLQLFYIILLSTLYQCSLYYHKGREGMSLTQDVLCSIVVEVCVFWEVVDLRAHPSFHTYMKDYR